MLEPIAQTKAKIGEIGYELPKTADLCFKALAQCTTHLKAAIQDELETRNLIKQNLDTLIPNYKASGNLKVAKKI